jgi:hypothetical protein
MAAIKLNDVPWFDAGTQGSAAASQLDAPAGDRGTECGALA